MTVPANGQATVMQAFSVGSTTITSAEKKLGIACQAFGEIGTTTMNDF